MDNERIITYGQKYPYRLQTNTYAAKKGGSGKGQFSVEIMVYVPGAGWDIVDINVHDNELAMGVLKKIQFNEFMGMEHVGDSYDILKAKLEKLWGYKIEE